MTGENPAAGADDALPQRPGLGGGERRLVTLACVAGRGLAEPLREQVRAALDGRELTVGELREAVLHVAVYGGWPLASVFDQVVAEEARRIGAPAWAEPAGGSPERSGAQEFELVNGRPARPPTTPLYAAVLDFVFGTVWQRPFLGRRERRLLSLVCTAQSGAEVPVRAHVAGALRSGDLTVEQLREVALHVATYGRQDAAARLAAVIDEEAARGVGEGG